MNEVMPQAFELTSRDLFAVFAMQAILSGHEGTHTNRWELARDAYRVADAMLEMRNEEQS